LGDYGVDCGLGKQDFCSVVWWFSEFFTNLGLKRSKSLGEAKFRGLARTGRYEEG